MKAESIAIGHCESTQPRTSGPTTTASACGRAPQTSSRPRAVAQDHQARAYGLASVVEPSVRAPIDGQRVRLARLMANPERDHEESDRTFWMADSKHHRTEATCRLRDVRLDAAAESRPVTAFRLAGQQPLTWKTAEPIEVAPQRRERVHPARAESRKVLRHRELIEGNREDRLLRAHASGSAFAVAGQIPEMALEHGGAQPLLSMTREDRLG